MDASQSMTAPIAVAASAPVYWKVLARDNVHHGFQWRAGLNVLVGDYNDGKLGGLDGRLYYCEQKHLGKFLGWGDHIQRVYEPVDDPLFRTMDFGDKKGANRLVLDAKVYSLLDADTYAMIGNVSIRDNPRVLSDACRAGRLDTLHAWDEDTSVRPQRPKVTPQLVLDAIKHACYGGHIDILAWLVDSTKYLDASIKVTIDMFLEQTAAHEVFVTGPRYLPVLKWWFATVGCRQPSQRLCGQSILEAACRFGRADALDVIVGGIHIETTRRSHLIDAASSNGHVGILAWWRAKWLSSFLPMVYTHHTMDEASRNGHVHVLDWWLTSGLSLKYTEWSMLWASEKGHVGILEWWLRSGLRLRYIAKSITYACNNGHVGVMNWWRASGLQIEYFDEIMDNASGNGRVDILQWWFDSGLPLKWSSESMDRASANGHVDVLYWWASSGLKLAYTSRAIDKASSHGHVHVLHWWRYKCPDGHDLLYTSKAMDFAADTHILAWWLRAADGDAFPLKYTHRAFDFASAAARVDVLDWWVTCGLPIKSQSGLAEYVPPYTTTAAAAAASTATSAVGWSKSKSVASPSRAKSPHEHASYAF